MPLASIIVGRSGRLRGFDACRLHVWLLDACRRHPLARAVCIQRRWQSIQAAWQELPHARHRRMPSASVAVGRSCRRQGTDPCRSHPLLMAGVAGCEALTRAACMTGLWQEAPLARHRRVPSASMAPGRSIRRRGISAGRLHALLLAGAACWHCCWQEPLFSNYCWQVLPV